MDLGIKEVAHIRRFRLESLRRVETISRQLLNSFISSRCPSVLSTRKVLAKIIGVDYGFGNKR